MATCQTLTLEPATKARLIELKVHQCETFNDVIERLVAMAVDDEPLSDETLRRLDEAEAEIGGTVPAARPRHAGHRPPRMTFRLAIVPAAERDV